MKEEKSRIFIGSGLLLSMFTFIFWSIFLTFTSFKEKEIFFLGPIIFIFFGIFVISLVSINIPIWGGIFLIVESIPFLLAFPLGLYRGSLLSVGVFYLFAIPLCMAGVMFLIGGYLKRKEVDSD